MERKTVRFSENVWMDLVGRVCALYHLDGSDRERIASCSLFKLATALPFLAGATDAYRISLNNLMLVLVMSMKGVGKEVFLHDSIDDLDVFHRLQLLYHEDGDHDIQMRGLALLAIVMINDYCTDMAEDSKNGKYNPVLTGAWDPDTKRKELISMVKGIRCPEMDSVFPLDDAVDQDSWILF